MGFWGVPQNPRKSEKKVRKKHDFCFFCLIVVFGNMVVQINTQTYLSKKSKMAKKTVGF